MINLKKVFLTGIKTHITCEIINIIEKSIRIINEIKKLSHKNYEDKGM